MFHLMRCTIFVDKSTTSISPLCLQLFNSLHVREAATLTHSMTS